MYAWHGTINQEHKREKPGLVEALKKQVDEGECPLVQGRLFNISSEDSALVYLCINEYIWGEISKYEWQKLDTRSFAEVRKAREPIDFFVTDYEDVQMDTGDEETIFILARKDPSKKWVEKEVEEIVHEGQRINVRCEYFPKPLLAQMSGFWGTLDAMAGIDVYVMPCIAQLSEFRVGDTYSCYVEYVNNINHIIHAYNRGDL